MKIGRFGEQLASKWLRQNGFRILFNNWRSGRYEIDIVALRHNIVHCIEVKTARTIDFGNAENKINTRKQANMIVAVERLLLEYGEYDEVQLDVLAISVSNRSVEFYLIEDIGSSYHR